MLNRRQFFVASVMTVSGGNAIACLRDPILVLAKSKYDNVTITIIQFSDSGEKIGPARVKKVHKSDAEWKQQLTPLQFEITRRAGTERAFSGQYDIHDQGLYLCICCNNALFTSETTVDSGTGWPSFWAPIARENIRATIDMSLLRMNRTAVSCTECEAHMGHVFNDGPKPTYLRYCMNSASLKFVKVG